MNSPLHSQSSYLSLSEITGRLAHQILYFYSKSLILTTDPIVAQRQSLLNRIQLVLQSVYGPKYHVAQFGSTAYGVSRLDSDVDISVIDNERPSGFSPDVDMKQLPLIYDPSHVAEQFAKMGFLNVQPIYASVPIIKLTDSINHLKCDININDQFGIRNSQLVKAYLDLSPIARPILTCIRNWAKQRGLNDPAGTLGPTTFSSYTLALLLIAYLQSKGHLPNLQDSTMVHHSQVERSYLWLRPPKSNQGRLHVQSSSSAVAGRLCCETTFAPSVPEAARWNQTHMDPGTALLDFFAYYSTFDFENQSVSIKSGGASPRLPFKPPASSLGAKAAAASSAFGQDGWQGNFMIVQDPFVSVRNTTQNIQTVTAQHIIKQFRVAYENLRWGLAEVFTPLATPIPGVVKARRQARILNKVNIPVPSAFRESSAPTDAGFMPARSRSISNPALDVTIPTAGPSEPISRTIMLRRPSAPLPPQNLPSFFTLRQPSTVKIGASVKIKSPIQEQEPGVSKQTIVRIMNRMEVVPFLLAAALAKRFGSVVNISKADHFHDADHFYVDFLNAVSAQAAIKASRDGAPDGVFLRISGLPLLPVTINPRVVWYAKS